MKVDVIYRNDEERPITDPVLEPGGRRLVFRIYRGDVCDPVFGTLFGYHWFEPPFPKYVLRCKTLAIQAVIYSIGLLLVSLAAMRIVPVSAAMIGTILMACGMIGLPFLIFKWPFMNRCCYIGWKLYGVDRDPYKNWMPAEEVFDGSQALCLTVRPFAKIA